MIENKKKKNYENGIQLFILKKFFEFLSLILKDNNKEIIISIAYTSHI